MIGQIFCQPIQQVRIPGRFFHIISGFNQAASEESLPKPIDDGASQAAILSLADQSRELLEAGRFFSGWIYVAKLRIDESQGRVFAGGLVAVDHFQWAVGVDASQ